MNIALLSGFIFTKGLVLSSSFYIDTDGMLIGDTLIPLWIVIIAVILLSVIFYKVYRMWDNMSIRKKYRRYGYEHVLNNVPLFSRVGELPTMRPIVMAADEKCIAFIDPYNVEGEKIVRVPLEMIDRVQVLPASAVTGSHGTQGYGGAYHAEVFDDEVPFILRSPYTKKNGESTHPDMSHLYVVIDYNKVGRKNFEGIGILASAYMEDKMRTEAYGKYVNEKLKTFSKRKRNKEHDARYDI